MKTASVKEASRLLGLTESAVRYRLHRGLLAGKRQANKNGKQEWCVDLDAALESSQNNVAAGESPSAQTTNGSQPDAGEFDASPEPENQLINAEPLDISVHLGSGQDASGRLNIPMIAEGLLRPLVEKLTMQTMQLAENQRIIEEQSRQLRLIPDLEKLAEREREAAERNQTEIDQLKNQISALAQEKEQLSKLADQNETLAGELEEWRAQSDLQHKEWEFQQQQLEALRAEIITVQAEKAAIQKAAAYRPIQPPARSSGLWSKLVRLFS